MQMSWSQVSCWSFPLNLATIDSQSCRGGGGESEWGGGEGEDMANLFDSWYFDFGILGSRKLFILLPESARKLYSSYLTGFRILDHCIVYTNGIAPGALG